MPHDFTCQVESSWLVGSERVNAFCHQILQISFLNLSLDILYVLTNKICLMPRSAFQSFFKVLTQISPLLATFGWKIFVMKNPKNGNTLLWCLQQDYMIMISCENFRNSTFLLILINMNVSIDFCWAM